MNDYGIGASIVSLFSLCAGLIATVIALCVGAPVLTSMAIGVGGYAVARMLMRRR